MAYFDVHTISYHWCHNARRWLIELLDEHGSCLKSYRYAEVDKAFRNLVTIESMYPEAVTECL